MSAPRVFNQPIFRKYCLKHISHHQPAIRDRDEEKNKDRLKFCDRAHRNFLKPDLDLGFTFYVPPLAEPDKYLKRINILSEFKEYLPKVDKDKILVDLVDANTVKQSFTSRVAHMENNVGVNLVKSEQLQEGLKHFTIAANNSCQSAQYNLGLCKFAEDEKRQAIDLWNVASKESHPSSTYQLAVAYLRGTGLPKDSKLGLELMHKAANMNSPDASFYLIVKYIKEHDMAKVRAYTRKAKLDVVVREKLHQIMAKKGFPPKAKQAITSELDLPT